MLGSSLYVFGNKDEMTWFNLHWLDCRPMLTLLLSPGRGVHVVRGLHQATHIATAVPHVYISVRLSVAF